MGKAEAGSRMHLLPRRSSLDLGMSAVVISSSKWRKEEVSRTYGGRGDEVGIPGAIGNFHVFDPIFSFSGLAKDVSIHSIGSCLSNAHSGMPNQKLTDTWTSVRSET